ncbi:transposase, partial [Rhodobacteraceae bacterium MBR-64]
GGKERLGRIFKMGNRYLRRLLYLGAIALANRMARTAYALTKNKTEFRAATTA